MLDADSHLPIYAADPDSPKHASARRFFGALSDARGEFVLCELILIELYMQLRNPAIFVAPYTAQESAAYCQTLKQTQTGAAWTTTRWCRKKFGLGRRKRKQDFDK